MADDCANRWGTVLTTSLEGRPIRSNIMSTKHAGGAYSDFSSLAQMVWSNLGSIFSILKVTANGSDANMFSVCDVTQGNTATCLVGCGSYVSGDGGPLQTWSTSDYSIKDGPCHIKHPEYVTNPFTKRNTVALPYHIPGTMDIDDLHQLEDRCLAALHSRCLVVKMNGMPFTCLLLELMLAGNGSVLSDRALTMIGKLAKHHQLSIIVDEIFTGGRTGQMLLSLSKPKDFVDTITHITMGKWLHLGLVLCSKEFKQGARDKMAGTYPRGTSTDVNCQETLRIWKSVFAELRNTGKRRQSVMLQLNLIEEECWGLGLIIFAPKRVGAGTFKGIKNRLIPLISNTPVNRNFRMQIMVEWTKQKINALTLERVEAWLDHQRMDNTPFHQLATGLSCGTIVSGHQLSREDVQKTILPGLNPYLVGTVLTAASNAGLLEYKVISKQRVRQWVIVPVCIVPWKKEEGGQNLPHLSNKQIRSSFSSSIVIIIDGWIDQKLKL